MHDYALGWECQELAEPRRHCILSLGVQARMCDIISFHECYVAT